MPRGARNLNAPFVLCDSAEKGVLSLPSLVLVQTNGVVAVHHRVVGVLRAYLDLLDAVTVAAHLGRRRRRQRSV